LDRCGPYKLAEVLAHGLKRNLLASSDKSTPPIEKTQGVPRSNDMSTTILKTEDSIESVLSESVSVLVENRQKSSTQLPLRNSSLVHVQEVSNDKPSILIVDDNPVNIRVIPYSLTSPSGHIAC
jgi:hypothetical protein